MRIQGSGTPSVSADNLTMIASDCPLANTGLFYAGKTAIPPSPLYDGLQCAGGDVRRFQGLFQISGTATDTGFVAQDPSAAYFQPGTTYQFQYWSRDVTGGPTPCGTAANFSPAYSVTMTP